MKKQTYFLVEAGYNPTHNVPWYDLVKADNHSHAQSIANKKNYGEVIAELTSNFIYSIGMVKFQMSYPDYAIKPLADLANN